MDRLLVRKGIKTIIVCLAAVFFVLTVELVPVKASETGTARQSSDNGTADVIVPRKVKKISHSLAEGAVDQESTGDEEEFRPKIYEDYREEMENHKEYIEDMIYFNQKDEVWNQNGYRVARSGCGPTSMAVVISSLTGEWVTPLDTIEWAYKHGYYSGDGSVHEAIPALAKAYGLTCKGLGTSYKKIRDALKKGHPVVCLMGPGYFTAGGHFMVLVSIDDKNCVTVADVGSRKRSSYKYRLKQIIGQAKSASAGGPFWALGYERMSGLAEGQTLRDYMAADLGDSFGTPFLADAQEGMEELTDVSLESGQLSRKFVAVTEPVSGGLLKTDLASDGTGRMFSVMTSRKSWVPVTGLLSEMASVDNLLTSGISVLRLE